MILHATTYAKANDTTTWYQLTTYGVLCIITAVISTPPDINLPFAFVPTPYMLKGFVYGRS